MPGEYSNTARSAIIALGGFSGNAPLELPTKKEGRGFALFLHLKRISLTPRINRTAGFAEISLMMSMHGQTKLSMHLKASNTKHCW